MTETDTSQRGERHVVEMPEELVDAIKDGSCVLFVGSALHAPPPETSPYAYPEEHRPPIGAKLSEAIADKFKLSVHMPGEPKDNLMRVSMFVETSGPFGRTRLLDHLDKLLKGSDEAPRRPSDAVRMLADLPFRIIVTTNYDLLLDEALDDAGKTPHILRYDPTEGRTSDIRDEPTETKPLLFKMHGDLTERKSVVITDEDYIGFVNRMAEKDRKHPVPETVRFWMQRWPTVFVGYSLRDYNLRLFFRMIRSNLDRTEFPQAFAVDKYPDKLIQAVWEQDQKLVAFLVEDIWSWAPEVYQLVKGTPYEPTDYS